MFKPFVVAAIVLATAGCQSSLNTEPVKMRNAATGETTQCGPFPKTILGQGTVDTAYAREKSCIQDYQHAGFERAP